MASELAYVIITPYTPGTTRESLPRGAANSFVHIRRVCQEGQRLGTAEFYGE